MKEGRETQTRLDRPSEHTNRKEVHVPHEKTITVIAVLLKPGKGPGDESLLADGACGARPPVAKKYECRQVDSCGQHQWWPIDHAPHVKCDCPGEWLQAAYPTTLALVLAWEGKPVPEGLDRHNHLPGRWVDTARRVRAYLAGDYSATHVVNPDLGTIVLLDENFREVER